MIIKFFTHVMVMQCISSSRKSSYSNDKLMPKFMKQWQCYALLYNAFHPKLGRGIIKISKKCFVFWQVFIVLCMICLPFRLMTLSYCNCFVYNYILYYMYLAHVVALKKTQRILLYTKRKS